MDKRVVGAIVGGIVMYLIVIYLASIQRDLTISQLVLMLAAPFVMGALSGGVKKGLMIGLIVSFLMLTVEAIVIQTGAFANPNVAMAVILMMVLPLALMSAGISAAGGLLGRRALKKSGQDET